MSFALYGVLVHQSPCEEVLKIAQSKKKNIDPANDIESYRKKRRRKYRIRKIIMVCVALVLIGGIALFAIRFDVSDISELLKQNTTTQNGTSGYPQKLFGRTIQFGTSGSLLALASDSHLYLFNSAGDVVLSDQHSYARPTMATANGRVLLYDRSGNNFRLDSGSSVVYEREMSNEIICAALNADGAAAIAAHEERYSGSVSVFNLQNQQIFKWYSADYQITGLAFDGSRLAAACIGARDGAILSTVNLMDTGQGSDQQVVSVEFPDMMILSVRFLSNGSLCVVGDSKTVVLSASGEVLAEYNYGKNINDFCVAAGDITVLSLASSTNAAEQEIVVLDQSAALLGSATINEEIKWITAGNGSVFLLSSNEILQYDQHMNLLKSMEVRTDSSQVCVIGSDLYILGLGEISKLSY